ncbi:MAG TPA: CvpA family protein [Acidobacteriaceae bacterium]|nr:CvpA family protein [Acidobacteriaceae bacterium]
MVLIDWLIVIVLLVSVLSAAKNGFFLEVFSLAGILIGLVLASWNYQRLLPWLTRWVRSLPAAEALSFLLIALGVMLLAGLLGRVVRWSVHSIGLGWADRFLGALFGFVKGFILITVVVLVIAAFFPGATWFKRSRLAPCFLTAAHRASALAPSSLELRIREGVINLRYSEPHWLKPAASLLIIDSKAGTTRA